MPAVATVTREVTVASWNIREALPVGASARSAQDEARREIGRVAEKWGIDVLALQEVDVDDGPCSETLDHLRENTDLQYSVVYPLSPSSYFPGRRAGVALASRTPVTNVRSTLFPNPDLVLTRDGRELRSHDKGVVSGTVRHDDGFEFTVASLHALPFYLFEKSPEDTEFDRLWLGMSATLADLNRGSLLVCGDFNSPNRKPLLGGGALDLQSTNDNDTYRSMSADDVLVSPRVRPVENAVVGNFSDHAALIGRFVVA